MNVDQQDRAERYLADYRAGHTTFEETVILLLSELVSEVQEMREVMSEPTEPNDGDTW